MSVSVIAGNSEEIIQFLARKPDLDTLRLPWGGKSRFLKPTVPKDKDARLDPVCRVVRLDYANSSLRTDNREVEKLTMSKARRNSQAQEATFGLELSKLVNHNLEPFQNFKVLHFQFRSRLGPGAREMRVIDKPEPLNR
ncbi:hypothetical protein PoB_002679500 [Plakobranchus ocellatus]|uniref:Uncharacterized protein n=1 Tax=Plakobranchus ocellatus TaxID=259542 RepID=A0AAV3ZYK5_9GAST|nr:hypothetical protein PoB_002679500 [Plakobranchus ocellatus]